MMLNKGILSSAVGIGVPMIYNFGLVRMANRLTEFGSTEFRLNEYLELTVWASLLQVFFYFGGNEYFAYLSLNEDSKAKISVIKHNVRITLYILLFSVVILAVLIFYTGIQYWPLVFVLVLMNLRVFIHFVLSSSGSYGKDFLTNILDVSSFLVILFISEIEYISLQSTVNCAIYLSLFTTGIQLVNYYKAINKENTVTSDLVVVNKRTSYFFKELLAFITANLELFVLLYLLNPDSQVFVEYNVLLRVTVIMSVVTRFLSKNVTLHVLKIEKDIRSRVLRLYQLKSLAIILLLFIFTLVIVPTLMKFFTGVENYRISLLTVLVLSLPIFRSFYTWNIYFNLLGANHLLNHVRIYTSIVGLLLISLLGYNFGVLGLVTGSILTSVLSLGAVIYLELRKFNTIFFE